MPITPFHFGPGALLHGASPRRVSFIAFCAANVLMDVEPLYYMLTRQFPLHRFLHTYVGALLVTAATWALFIVAHRLTKSIKWVPDVFGWKQLTVLQVAAGAALGAFSHIVFDSVMHADIRPFAPFSDANPLLRVVSLSTLHLACLAAGALGLCVVGIRKVLRDEHAGRD